MLKVTSTTVYDSAGSAKCGELFCQGSTNSFSIRCAFCELKFLEYDVFLMHFRSVHFEKNATVVPKEEVGLELVTVHEEVNDHENDAAVRQRLMDKSNGAAPITKRELNELRSQLKEELKKDLQQMEQRILLLEKEIKAKRKPESESDDINISIALPSTKRKQKSQSEDIIAIALPSTKRKPESKSVGDNISIALPKYPFKTMQNFQNYEKLFENNDKNLAQLVSQFLIHVQVEDPVQFIRLCWRKIMQDVTAQHLCWRGTLTKPAISTSIITAAIKDAYVSKFPQTATVYEFDKTCIVYFQKAKRRFERQSSHWQRVK